MDKTELNKILELSGKIDSLKSKISMVDKILKSCNVTAQISGTPPGRFGSLEYNLRDSGLIKPILELEKSNLESDLVKLELEFSKISIHFQ